MASIGLLSFQNTMIKQDIFNVYPSVNLSYRFNSNWEAYASFNTSSRLPSYTELYYKDAVHEANPNLEQEKSISYEGGVNYKNKVLNLNISTYYTQGKNLIDWMKNSATDDKWVCRNINQLNKYGVDISSRFLLDELIQLSKNTVLTISYSWMNAERGNNTYISQYIFNYLKHKVNFELSLPILDNFTLNLAGKYCVREGSFVEYVNNVAGEEKEYDPFFTMDANLNYRLNSMFTFFVAATNIFNVDYYDIGNIPQPGRWITAGVKFNL